MGTPYYKVPGCNDLEDEVNRYRKRKNLKALQCSEELRVVSKLHVYDFTDTAKATNKNFQDACNGHGWYSKHKNGCPITCCNAWMLHKFRPNTNIRHRGENAYWSSNKNQSNKRVVQAWHESTSGHRETMQLRDIDAIGCYKYGNHWNCIFGTEAGPKGTECWEYFDKF